MDRLPPEVLEQIFAHVPMLELLTIMQKVCVTWHDIISRPRFLPWKKSYFRYKLQRFVKNKSPEEQAKEKENEDSTPPAKKSKVEYDSSSEDDDEDYNNDNDMKGNEFFQALGKCFSNDYINVKLHLFPPVTEKSKTDKFRLETAAPWLINFICQEFEKEALENQLELMKNHTKFSWAKDWLQERMPEFLDKVEIASIPVICCIAESTWDIEEIFRVLLRPSLKSCRSHVLTEIMYCIAMAFLIFQRDHQLPTKYHYQVFHAISFFENEFNITSKATPAVKKKGQASLTSMGFTQIKPKFQLTAEQARIASHKLEKGGNDVIKIVAFAGTGKTTTLIKMCQEHPNLKFLVVVYNASVARHAESVFPKNNVTCKTAHSLAFGNVGKYYRHKLCDNLKPRDVLDSGLMEKGISTEDGHFQQRAAQILATIESYMNSPDTEIDIEHVPYR